MGKPTRESEFIEFCRNLDKNLLNGKISFQNKEKIYISFDNSIIIEDKIILIEIDASNMAKLTTGQFILLHTLRKFPTTKCQKLLANREIIFFVIHFFKSFNPERSRKNFRLINSIVKENPIQFGTAHFNEILKANIQTKEVLLQFIEKTVKKSMEK